MARLPIFADDFSDGNQDLPVLSGTGSAYESGGALVVTVPGGTNADWYTFGRNGVLPHVGLATFPSNWLKIYYEFTIRSWSTTDVNNSHLVATLAQSDTALWLIGTANGTDFWVLKNWSGIGSSISTTLPRKFRFVWDLKLSTITIQCETTTDTWTNFVTDQAISMTPARLGFGLKNWNTLPSITAQYENVLIYAEIADDVFGESSGFEDKLSVPEQGNFDLTHWKWGNLNSADTGRTSGVEDKGLLGTNETGSAQTGFMQAGNLTDRPGEGLEDSVAARLGLVPPYRPTANDPEGHPYFLETLGSPRLRFAFLYDATNDAWNNPAVHGLNGYGRDGHLYVAGVQQVTMAPWATEAAGANRSSRPDFPVKSLLVTSQSELVIFDLDNWPTSITVWMRFRLGDASNFYLLGRVADSLRQTRMLNGTLMVGSLNNGVENGGLFCIDFKRTSTDFALLVRADGWWKGAAARDITHRNQISNWASQGTGFTLDSEYVHFVDAAVDTGTADRERMWVAAGSEDLIRVVEIQANQPKFDYNPVGGLVGPYNDFSAGLKCSFFDSAGWLWMAWGPYVFRAIGDFHGGVIVMGANAGSPELRHPYARLVHPHKDVVIQGMTQVNESIYVRTNVGVYRINRFTLDAYLCYTVEGGFGGGRLNTPPAGELLGGEKERIQSVQGFVVNRLGNPIGYLAVATSQANFDPTNTPQNGSGSITLIRTYDDAVIDRRTHTGYSSGLLEDGAWFLMPFGT